MFTRYSVAGEVDSAVSGFKEAREIYPKFRVRDIVSNVNFANVTLT